MTPRSLIKVACAVLLVGLLPIQAQGATFTVTKTADTNDGTCNADCSLREAVVAANASGGSDTISVPAGTHNLTLDNDLIITGQLTINGAGETGTIIDGQALDRVFDIDPGITVNMSNLTIRNGDIGGGDGGNIRNEGNLTLTNVTVRDGDASKGGGIHSQGATTSLSLTDVTVTDNAADNGAGIYLKDAGASMTVTGGSITNNTTGGSGGGIYNARGDVTLTSVTVSGNSAKVGGGVWNKETEAVLDITNSVFSQNTSGREDGGAIYNDKGRVTIDTSTFNNNTGTRDGGALYSKNSASIVTISDTTFSSNQTTNEDGGAIFVEDSTLTINRVTLNNNVAARDGGAVWTKNATTTLTNVTVSGNSAPGDEGGGIRAEKGFVQLNNVTLANNSAGTGGGVFVHSDPISLFNTIVADSPSGGNCSGSITSQGNNLDTANTCALTGTGDLINSRPNLGLLQNNGGLTQTHALGSASAAIDTGNDIVCPASDQRGVARPIDGDGDSIALCDIGAYEAPIFNAANLALTMTDSVDPVSVGGAFTYNLTATNDGPVDATNVVVVDSLPADVEWQSATPSQGSCVHSGEPLGGTVTCTLGTIANGANATIDIGIDAQGAIGVISNTATVSADEPDPDASDNTAAEDTTIIDPSADLGIVRIDDNDPAGINLPLLYTVSVTNNGPADAALVTVVDTLPGAVTYQTAVPSQGVCAEAAGIVTCDLGALANGSIATIDILVTAPGTPQTISNSVVVSATEPDSDLTNNTWLEDTDIVDPASANLELTQLDSPDPVVAGTPLTYTLTIDNLGLGAATGIQFTDTLPAGVTFVSAVPSGGSCGEALGVVTCNLDPLANGASATVVIVVTAPATAGPITNSASVSALESDPDLTNNSVSAGTIVTIVGNADLSLSMSDSPDPVRVNQTLSYSLVVGNLGPDSATDVILVDTLPAAVTFQSAITSRGSCSEAGGTVTCALGMIASGADATVDILVTAPANAGSIINNASVSGSSIDSNAANDNATENTTVENLNVNQLCYLVADAGGGNGGNDLLTRIDTADFNPLTNETNIGNGTGTNTIEAIAWNSSTGVLYAANASRLGTLSTLTGVFSPLPSPFGQGSGAFGNITFSDVDGLTYDATTGVLYGVHARGGTDVLIQIDMATGAHVANAFGAGVDYLPLPPVLGNSITDDIVVDPTTGFMYATVNSGGSSDRLIRIDKATGATTDVALLTVRDIEGLGTDPAGQLWGTSGTQNILYEIDKNTGIGSNGRPINNGGDYESIDCYAFSPIVIADLGVTKTVDNALPPQGAVVTYTVTVTNTGPGAATVVQLSDALPAGVSFVAANPGQGTYNSATGAWFVGTLGAGSNAALTLEASVDSGTLGAIITNTASVDFVSQYDPNASNDAASVDIELAGVSLTVLKSVITVRDPLGAVTPAALAIPGATVEYEISLTNSGNGAATEVVVSDTLNAKISFLAGEYNGGTADIEIIVGTAAPVYCIAEVDGDSNADGCFLNAASDDLTVSIPISATYPTGLTVGTTAPDNAVVVRFRVSVK